MKESKKNIITFQYKFKKPKRLENDVFVIYSPKKITLKPGEMINLNMGIKIFLPKFIEGNANLLFSYSNQGLKLLNSNCISQIYNRNIEIEEVYTNLNSRLLPPWNLNFNLQNSNFTKTLTIKNRQELAYLSIFNNTGEEIKHTFKKKH